jgi:hypothetical protein
MVISITTTPIFCSVITEAERLRDLEEQQDLLNSSLSALTTHFAQVGFQFYGFSFDF